MTMITDSISYNVRERGRKFRGVDRNFDTAALAKLINGPAIQEQVKHGDMLGYLGHWPRVKFGLPVVEGGVDPVTGKAVALPIAVRTVELHAEPDGTITHREEFLDTEAGQIAEGLYKSKAGGFSSAIDPVPRTSPVIPRGFYGFDFVYEPNYTTNRGHKVILDAAGAVEMTALMDAVMEHASIEREELVALFDSLHGQHLDALESLERLQRENDDLISRLAAGGKADPVLDAVAVPPTRVRRIDPASAYGRFADVPLEALSRLPDGQERGGPEMEYARRKFGF